MAKLHEDSDDDLPDLAAVIATYAKADLQKHSTRSTGAPVRERGQVPSPSQRKPPTSLDIRLAGKVNVKSPGSEIQRTRRHRSLKGALVNTVFLSRWNGASEAAQASVDFASTSEQSMSASVLSESTAKDALHSGREALGWRIHPQGPSDQSPTDTGSRCADKEVFNGDTSHTTQLPKRRGDERAAGSKSTAWSTFTGPHATSVASGTSVTGAGNLGLDCMQAGTSSSYSDMRKPLATASLLLGDEFGSEPSALLRLYLTTATQPRLRANLARSSPPRSRRRSPAKGTGQQCFTTPPATPSKSKLQSPKKQHRIPPSPHRPSIDAFWSQDVINDWNDGYSPRKVPKPGRARTIYSAIDEDDEEFSPSASPQRSPVKCPVRRDRKALNAKKAFHGEKHKLAQEFLKELDDSVAGGRVASLAASTGGVHLIWSKKLNSTAGRANWRQEVVRSNGNVEPPSSTYRHHASIELAEKVIDDESKSVNIYRAARTNHATKTASST